MTPAGMKELLLLLVADPHPYDLDGPYFLQDLVYKPMLDIDATGIGAGKVSHQFFITYAMSRA